MAQKRSTNKSKRDRVESARAKMRAAFDAGKSPTGEARGFRPQTILQAAWDIAHDIEGFVRKYLSHYMVDQETGLPVEPAQFHKELYKLLLTLRLAAIAAPREHAKSTVVSCFFVLYCIAHKLRRFIVLLSDTESQAKL